MRQAAAYAIDVENVLEKGYMGDGVLTDNIYYPGFMGVSDTLNNYKTDLDKSIELMAESGYQDRDLNGKIENDDGEEVSITILVNKDNSVRSAAAKIIAKDLSNVGFSVTLDSKDWDEYVEAIEKQEFDILITGYDMEASYDLRDFFDGDTLWEYTNNDILEKASQLEELHDASEYTKTVSYTHLTLPTT